MEYTSPMNLKKLRMALEQVARENNFRLEEYDFSKPETATGDGKVTREFILKVGLNETVRIYDYKMTKLYDRDEPAPRTFYRTDYEWHINGSSKFILQQVKNLVDNAAR